VEKWYVLMLSILEKSGDFEFSKCFFEFLRIHIWLTPHLEYAMVQYLWNDSLIAVSSLVSNKDSALVEHFLEQQCIFVCKDFYVISDSNRGRVNRSDLDF
jgi:hypothetical protein